MQAEDTLVRDIDVLSEKLIKARQSIERRFVGQHDVVEEALAAILSGGHALLIGQPGLGKTLLVDTIAGVMGLETARVQFTPDLMPADILGSEVLETSTDGQRAFRFIEGPVFTQLLMADEINRASPRTQSALLQAMQESEVTVAGKHRQLGRPFHVLATQNPLDQEGTYPLPEAQLDRFLLQIALHYPDRDTERDILLATTGQALQESVAVFDPDGLLAAQALIRQMPVGETVITAILDLVRAARPGAGGWIDNELEWGAGTRAAQALSLASRARAVMSGRFAPSIDDVRALARPVLRHRISLSFAARARGTAVDDVIDRLTDEILGPSREAQ